ncbi:pleckstrin homology domain-containing family G member 7 isoform X2 [Narcine bancroftii]|uniref:pleckstrin homology domain-containing family G member 7 isoform X2 n=1 Tax=Narcine bancroftii TaxID=1343680 RepID=UPI0038311A30
MEVGVSNLPCGTYLETWEQGCEMMNLGGDENPFEGKNGLKDSQNSWECNVEEQTRPVETESQEDQLTENLVSSKSMPILTYSFSPDVEVSQSPCFQFDRMAPARVSLSPSLRRIGRTMLKHQPLQEFWEAGRPLKDTEDPKLSAVSQSPSPAAGQNSNVQRPLCEETPSQPKPSQDSVQSVKGLLGVDNCGQSTPQTDPGIPLWARRRGDCQMALLDNPQQTTQESKPERYSSTRRGSSVVICLPELEVFPGDLLISNGTEDLCRTASTPTFSTESKKLKWPFTKRGMNKGKQKAISDLETLLATFEVADCEDRGFQPYKVFLKTLKFLQSRGWLIDVDPWRLFANLNELSKVSLDFLTSLLAVIQSSWDLPSLIEVLSKFQERVCCCHQKYCLNYSSANVYLSSLKTRDDFGIFLKWCEQNDQCKRLHLSDLLVSPLQRLTRYPLLLRSLWNRSSDAAAKQEIEAIIRRVDHSICDLEGKVKWLERIHKFQQLQEFIVWPPVWERNKKVFVPESLRHLLKDNSADSLLSPANRQLIYEGRLTLAEATKFVDVHLFLFDDLLLLTKIKNAKKKAAALDTGFSSSSSSVELQAMGRDGVVCCVLEQPIPLDRVTLKNVDSFHSSGCGLRDAFLVIHQNRYQQCIGVFTLQAQSESVKKTWISQIETASNAYRNTIDPPQPPPRSAVKESSEI